MDMIKKIPLVLLMFFSVSVFAQTSQKGFSYQGYAVNEGGVTLPETVMDVRTTVYSKNGAGYIYEETHSNIQSNFYGIISLVIGEQSPATFQKLNFTAKGADYWLKVEVKVVGEPLFITISNKQILAQPYARFANNGVPVGTIISFGADASMVPEGWLICDGTQYDGTNPEYEKLYSTLENTWGGTGTEFNVPDLRGYFLRGLDNSTTNDPDAAGRTALIAGGNTGDAVGSYQTGDAKPHDHPVDLTTNTTGNHNHTTPASYGGDVKASTSDADYVLYNSDGSGITGTGSVPSSGSHTHTVNGNTDNNTEAETRPKNAYVLYIIKY